MHVSGWGCSLWLLCNHLAVDSVRLFPFSMCFIVGRLTHTSTPEAVHVRLYSKTAGMHINALHGAQACAQVTNACTHHVYHCQLTDNLSLSAWCTALRLAVDCRQILTLEDAESIPRG